MRITLVDLFEGTEPKPDILAVARALQRQISEDFAPIWGLDASLRVVNLSDAALDPGTAQGLRQSDGIVYVSPEDGSGADGLTRALSYHFKNHRGIPCGFVFPAIAQATGEPWSVAAAQEILRMLVDPDLNQLVGAPHPLDPAKSVLRPREVCDPVRGESYAIDGIRVPDFVTLQYFTKTARHPGGRQPTHYLGQPELDPFGLLPGGYFVYLDLDTREWRHFPDLRDVGAHPAARSASEARQQGGIASRGFRRLRLDFNPKADTDWLSAIAALDGEGGSNGGGRFPAIKGLENVSKVADVPDSSLASVSLFSELSDARGGSSSGGGGSGGGGSHGGSSSGGGGSGGGGSHGGSSSGGGFP